MLQLLSSAHSCFMQGQRQQISTISATAVPSVWPPAPEYQHPGGDIITSSVHTSSKQPQLMPAHMLHRASLVSLPNTCSFL